MKEKFSSNGWLLVDKPEGVESFGVIRKLKFRFQFHKIGFAGTLDPLATGLLLIGINKATKKFLIFTRLKKPIKCRFDLELKHLHLTLKGDFKK